MIDKNREFESFITHVDNIRLEHKDTDLNEINNNFQSYGVRETTSARHQIEYFTKLNYKQKNNCFCDKGKTIYFEFINALEDAKFYKRYIYVCDLNNPYRIYHTATPK